MSRDREQPIMDPEDLIQLAEGNRTRALHDAALWGALVELVRGYQSAGMERAARVAAAEALLMEVPPEHLSGQPRLFDTIRWYYTQLAG